MNSQRHRLLETPRNENEEAEPNSHIICYQGLVEFLPFQVTKRNEITLFVAVTEKVAAAICRAAAAISQTFLSYRLMMLLLIDDF